MPKYISGSHMKALPSWCVYPGDAQGLVTPIGAVLVQPRIRVWLRGTSFIALGTIGCGSAVGAAAAAAVGASAAAAVGAWAAAAAVGASAAGATVAAAAAVGAAAG